MAAKFVRDLMDHHVATCHMDTPLVQVAQRMVDEQVDAVAIVDSAGALCGIVTQTDMVRVYNQNHSQLTAEDVMSGNVATVIPDIAVAAAAQLMLDMRVHQLVIVHPRPATQRPIAMLSMRDLVRDMVEKKS